VCHPSVLGRVRSVSSPRPSNWEAAITALNSGGLPCSGGERRILHLSASLAAGTPVDLRDTVTGLDDHNTARLLAAIRHATGNRPENSRHQ
jgi:ABC-type transport system involved in cytochrome bd biosynthesis fused ATPase/permease subunit